MARDNGNGKVTLAVLKADFKHLYSHQEELKSDIKEIKNILTEGQGKIRENRVAIDSLKEQQEIQRTFVWKLIGATVGILGLAISVVAAIK